MKTDYFELKLSTMTLLESIQYPETYKGYLNTVFRMQAYSHRNLALSLPEVLTKTGLPDIAAVDQQYPFRFFNSVDQHGKHTQNWYDMQADIEVMPTDQYYEPLFAFKLRQINLMQMDIFLQFHLDKYHGNQAEKYLRFLTLILRSYSGKILHEDQVLTVKEWIEAQKTGDELTVKTKGKIKRTPDDGITLMSQEETTLFIHFMRLAKMVLQDEYLTNKEAGLAFSILTGYSPDSIRQKLGKSELLEIFTKKNLEGLHKTITRLELLIKKVLKDIK